MVRRWRKKDQVANIYGTRKYNDLGRYMSIPSLKGEAILVIMVTELASNTCWRYVAFKSETLLNALINRTPNYLLGWLIKTSLFAKVAKDSKWQTQPPRDDIVNSKGLVEICLAADFVFFEWSTLSDVRRWSSSVWRKAFDVNIYEMAGNLFLFEFPNSNMVEQIMQGEWVWKSFIVKLERWSHFVVLDAYHFNRGKLQHGLEQ